ncbi:kinesin-domain-containing protein [Rickenella mellea]|uniref:Kinesin-domain-containing protein n=1 Tax=Rickenella mellea TaxID=50990 RepID=A0A4Y7QKR5_9AGAM|nr:kinesin-domain-containing protein [Rickenella mellea]
MSTRRPPSRARNPTASAPNPSTRPRSALPKPPARTDITTPTDETFAPGTSLATSTSSTSPTTLTNKPRVVHHGPEDVELNIQVVIRCRRRSEREIQDSSPIIVSSNGPRGKDVTIETSAPSSILGLVTLAPTRTYPFDLVFGPEADQALVYQDVVQPMLEEVIKGYNCTLFAYGQTGTGKTYTMQGDVNLTPLGNPSSHAGMIPRVLFKLFQYLDASGMDFSVKVSFVELYNEELRDLLATELSAPAGSGQPMSMGALKENQGGLKMFDDSSKKGVFIQGMEEICVKDFGDAIALLLKGSHRRQIAATKFNDHSSRSHSVFSITVHCKETSTLGDDLLKVGKLNLVDLAGAENIGRSGAENKRAREAGMINQSLLTLGRVINALVERSSHVPYRESKLTRLLQDSLGGRTKTCIIATISPARSNMEETLSTLDYASRAKSIRNKPEINQRMTRNALLKDYVAEIDRLKSDLLAAREKNGIYFSEETWNQLNTEHELKQTEVEEAKKQVDIVESQLRTVREEFEQSIALFMKTDGELKETKEQLRQKEEELAVQEGALKDLQTSLDEEVVVRQAHASNELVLDAVASGLKKTVDDSTNDVTGLFAKLERQTATFRANSKAIAKESSALDSESQSLLAALQDFSKSSRQRTAKVQTEAANFKKMQSKFLSEQSAMIDQHVAHIQAGFQAVQATEDDHDESLAKVHSVVRESQEKLAQSFATWSVEMMKSFEATCVQVEESGIQSCTIVEKSLNTVSSLIDVLLRDTQAHIEMERKATQEHAETVNRHVNDEVVRLQEQNEKLLSLLESETTKAANMRSELIQRINSLLVDFSEQRDNSLRNAVFGFTNDNESAADTMRTHQQVQIAQIDESIARGMQLSSSLEKTGSAAGKEGQSGLEGIATVKTGLHDGFARVQQSTASSVSRYSVSVVKQAEAMNASCSSAFERADRSKRARIDTVTSLKSDAELGFQSIQRDKASTSSAAEDFSSYVLTEAAAMSNDVQKYSKATTTSVNSIRKRNQSILERGTKDDAPTGATPRKRAWDYVGEWELTKSRESLLRDHYQHNLPSPDTNEPNVGALQLPESDEIPVEDVVSSIPVDDEPGMDVDVKELPHHTDDDVPPTMMQPVPAILKAKTTAPVRALAERPTNIVTGRAARKR